MKKHVLVLLATCASTASFFSAAAQYTDTTAKPAVTDSIPKTSLSWNAPAVKNRFPYKSFIVPATFVVYGVISLHTDALQDINETVHKEVHTAGQSHKTSIDNYLQYAPAVAVYGLNIAGIHGKNNFLDRTMLYGLSSLMMGITVNITKNVTGEIRPDGSNNLSFPSGHTATAFASAEFLRQEYKDVSVWYGIAGYAAATATGYLRIVNNKHWVGDVVAGAGVGIISTRLAYWIYPAIKRSLFRNKDVHTIVMPVYQEGALGLGLVHHF
jgi:hypothetical protein